MYIGFIARRLFSHSGTDKRVSLSAMRIATAGVAVGVAIMLVSVSVVMGFQQEIRGKLMGLGSHIQVLNYESLGSAEMLPIAMDSALMQRVESIPHVRHVQRFCMKGGMLKTEDAFRGIMLRGVGQEYDQEFLRQHLTEGEIPQFSDSTRSGKILISHAVAAQLGLKMGDDVYSYFFDQTIRVRKFHISGIYRTGLTDFDDRLVFTDLGTVRSLLRWEADQVSGLEVLLDDYGHAAEALPYFTDAVNKLQDHYGAHYTSLSLQELYPQMFSWLALMDMDVWVILVLMTCVAGFTMISGLLIIILERTNFIGVMKALGATNGQLRHLFLYFAVLIILRGMLIGNAVALCLMLVQKYTGIVQLDAEVYYVDAVPVLMDWTAYLLINLLTITASTLALIVPSYLVSNIHPARSIRFE